MSAANVKARGAGRSHKTCFSNRMLDTTVTFMQAAVASGAKKVAA